MTERQDREEQAYADMERMFKEYDLSEYESAWETFKGYFERVCRENREMREQLRKAGIMKREKYVAYLRQQGKSLLQLADEIESGGPVTCEWMIDWELHREDVYLQAELNAEQDKAAEETGKDVA